MKTSLRILTMSLFALVALSFASETFASKPKIIWTYDDGTSFTVDIAKDGSFSTQALKTGRVKVQFFWDRSSASGKAVGAVDNAPVVDGRGLTPDDQNRHNDKIEAFVFHYEIIAPRDQNLGLASGKRQHAPPLTITLSSSEKLLPIVNKKFGSIEIDKDCGGITGKIELQDQNGKTMSADTWTYQKK